MNPRAIQPGYLSLKDAATWASVSVRTVRRWISLGLPKYQAGPKEKVLIRPDDIDRFLIRQQTSPPNLDALVEDVLKGLTPPQKASKS